MTSPENAHELVRVETQGPFNLIADFQEYVETQYHREYPKPIWIRKPK